LNVAREVVEQGHICVGIPAILECDGIAADRLCPVEFSANAPLSREHNQHTPIWQIPFRDMTVLAGLAGKIASKAQLSASLRDIALKLILGRQYGSP
jgi:hypothetical protein